MRTYGRTYDANRRPMWVEVQTDANGYNDYVYATALIQVLKLNIGESPFYANYGIPAHNSVVQQVAPDVYVSRVQQQFAQFFASLVVSAQPTGANPKVPNYNVNITTHQGLTINTAQIPQ